MAAIGDAKTCPHGHPINVGDADRRACRSPTSRRARSVRVLRFENEAEDLLHYLKDVGPRARASRARSPPPTTTRSRVASNGGEHVVTRSVAETVSVTADPSPPPRTALPEQLVLGGPLRPLRPARRHACGSRHRLTAASLRRDSAGSAERRGRRYAAAASGPPRRGG